MPRSISVGPYRILRLINQGGQGTLYLGFDDRLHRRVAIKIVRLPKDKISRRDLLREAKVVASIQSPKVVQIYDLIVAKNPLWPVSLQFVLMLLALWRRPGSNTLSTAI
jgi:serine/threonine protein kinase